MAKWFGTVGYVETAETSPGVWTENITEREYYGDVISNNTRWSANSNSTNDDLNINHRISILADPFAYEKFHALKYVEFMDAKWEITNIEVQRPRLVLSIGGVYNGEQA